MKKLVLALSAALFSQLSLAAEGTFCNSPTNSNNPSSDKTVYVCGNGIKGTLPELYKLGWRVVAFHMFETADSNSRSATLILEKS